MKINEVMRDDHTLDRYERLKPKKPVGTRGSVSSSTDDEKISSTTHDKETNKPMGYGMDHNKSTNTNNEPEEDTKVGTNNLKTPSFIKNRRKR